MSDNSFAKQKERVKKLLNTSVFVSEDMRQSILSKIDEFDEGQLEAMARALLNAMKKQNKLMTNLSKEDPKFILNLSKTVTDANKNLVAKNLGEELSK